MRAYLITTGTVFGLITLAHILGALEEGGGLMRQPWFVLLTVATTAICLWAVRLLLTPGEAPCCACSRNASSRR